MLDQRVEAPHSNVVVFPPVIPATGFALGVVLERVAPATSWTWTLRGFGMIVFALGVAGFAWMVITMKRARTPIHNSATPSRLVEHGPFRRTRNPMYVFGSTAYAGAALALVQPWSLALLPVVLAATHYGVVLREEAFLETHFGDDYRRYKDRVRRWI
jgi:protein-S-isoprenylcysteine O-methyltransferase Ste14